MAIALVVLLGGILIGSMSLIRGWTGRRIDDHPLCRRCGFDLTGRPATSHFCPECGAPLAARKSIIIGHRRRRWRLLATGSLLLAVSLTAATALIWDSVEQISWLRLEPTWWLLHVAKRSPSVATPELAELTARLADGRLTLSQAQRLEDAALAIQADPSISWNSNWGDLLESAQSAGKLSPQRWTQYAAQALHSMPVTLELRPTVRQGDPLPYRVAHKPARTGKSWMLYVNVADIRLRIASKQMPTSGGSATDTADGTGSIGSDFTARQLPRRLPLGTVQVNGSLKLQLTSGLSGPTLATEQRPLAAKFNLVLPSTPTITALPDDPGLRASLQQAIRVEQFQHSRSGSVQMQIGFKVVPVPISYRITIKADGQTYSMGTLAMPASSGEYSMGLAGGHIPLTSQTADVVLDPDPSAAASTTDTFQYFDGQIVLHDMVVKQVP